MGSETRVGMARMGDTCGGRANPAIRTKKAHSPLHTQGATPGFGCALCVRLRLPLVRLDVRVSRVCRVCRSLLTVVDVSDGSDVEMRLAAHEGGEVRQDRASEA